MKRVDVSSSEIPSISSNRISSNRSLCGIGLDFGRHTAKLHLQTGGLSYREEIPSHRRPAEEVLQSIVGHIAEVAGPESQVEAAALASDLSADQSDDLMARLAEALPETRFEAVVDLDPRAAPWHAFSEATLPEETAPLWILDVGWLETGLHQVVAESGAAQVVNSCSEQRFHGRLIDLGILTTLREFGLISDASEAFGDMDSQEYKLALDLKHQLSTQQVVRPPGGSSMRANMFEQDLFKQTEWKGFPDLLVNGPVRSALEQGGRLVLIGGSCRLPWLVGRLLQGLPGLTPVEAPGGDPAYVRALGLACCALEQVVSSWTPPALEATADPVSEPVDEPLKVAASVDTSVAPSADLLTGETSPEDGDEALLTAPARPAIKVDTDGLHVRLAGTLVPMFEAPIHCGPVPHFLSRDGRTEIDVQCFDGVGGDTSSPRFLGRRTVEVPEGRGYVLRMELVEAHPLEVKVAVSTGKNQIFKEYVWNVMEER